MSTSKPPSSKLGSYNALCYHYYEIMDGPGDYTGIQRMNADAEYYGGYNCPLWAPQGYTNPVTGATEWVNPKEPTSKTNSTADTKKPKPKDKGGFLSDLEGMFKTKTEMYIVIGGVVAAVALFILYKK
jgi:hypothetical protein